MRKERPFSNAIERLRAAGLRPTRQRLAMAKFLFSGIDRHITAETLHAEVRDSGHRVSLATVYNALHQFTKAGLLREVVAEAGKAYFDTNISDHHHFYFEATGELQDIPSSEIRVSALPAPPTGTAVRRVDVVIRVDKTRN
jgi:Fur family iron response transcriptional regulator